MKTLKNYNLFINENINNDNDFKVESINDSDIPKLLELKYDFFAKSYNYNREKHDNYSLEHTDWSISKKLMDGDKIIGGYFLRRSKIENEFITDPNDTEIEKHITIDDLNNDEWIENNLFYDIRPLYNKKGIEGVSLFIDKNYQSLGLGQLLIDGCMKDPNIDYMFGYAYHTLQNIKSWMKRRYLILDTENFNYDENIDYGYYMTLETKKLSLKMTELGKKYKLDHPELNFNVSRGFII